MIIKKNKLNHNPTILIISRNKGKVNSLKTVISKKLIKYNLMIQNIKEWTIIQNLILFQFQNLNNIIKVSKEWRKNNRMIDFIIFIIILI